MRTNVGFVLQLTGVNFGNEFFGATGDVELVTNSDEAPSVGVDRRGLSRDSDYRERHRQEGDGRNQQPPKEASFAVDEAAHGVKILREILLALLRRWGGTAEVRKSSGEPLDKLRELTGGCPRLFCVLLAVLGGVALEHRSSRRGQKNLPSLS